MSAPVLLLAGHFDEGERELWQRGLQAELPQARIVFPPCDPATAAEVEIAIVANPPPGTLQGLPALKLIQSRWAGVDRLLADPTLPAGVPVARMVDPVMTEAMVQTALWTVLSLHRRFFDYAAQQRERVWRPLPQRRADEVAVLVLGQGQLGGAVAQRLAAQGYRVSGWRREARGEVLPAWTVHTGEEALPRAVAEADVVVNLLPLTAATRGLLDARFFGGLREGAGLVNLARGEQLVDEDLLAALDAGRVGHAVLDVFHREPLPADHRFWTHPRVTVLPHVAALTDARSAVSVVAANVRRVMAGQTPQHLVQRGRGY
jgi:glyoxylate/hydroxypyruvate reductase A